MEKMIRMIDDDDDVNVEDLRCVTYDEQTLKRPDPGEQQLSCEKDSFYYY
jgi:hypothetical protein